ncbi:MULTISPECIES: hypothetical protein [unclassified Brevibacterium]|uniref:DUF6912 family protein n=1 Tax=unclassified Brevibacterium TaxID=2614124 RepID=UPI0010F9B91C|nr:MULTISPECIES: hypothetical protein [unclassified Brevibacterium]MCM1014112.1 hypothetical protein [Brevibacterium sp. XM4083]
MAVRCYIPTTLAALAAGLQSVTAVAPDAAAAQLRGDDLDEAEFTAMSIAAALAADEALGSGAESASPRVVVAYDAPSTTGREPLAPGFDALTLTRVDEDRIVSVHLDEASDWEAAIELAAAHGAEAAGDRLGESDLLWYDRTELRDLLRDRT